ncbi:MAG: FMN-binding protein [Clostridiaceae bacterium]
MKKRFLAGVMVAALGLTLVACGGGSKAAFKDGDYKATTKGHNGDLTVNVQVADGKIKEIKVTDHKETEGIFDGVEENLIPEIIKKQSTEVDTISGATVSSKAVIEAVNKALEEGK